MVRARSEEVAKLRGRYQTELDVTPISSKLRNKAKTGTVTLIYGARDQEHNEALVLKRFLEQRAAPLVAEFKVQAPGKISGSTQSCAFQRFIASDLFPQSLLRKSCNALLCTRSRHPPAFRRSPSPPSNVPRVPVVVAVSSNCFAGRRKQFFHGRELPQPTFYLPVAGVDAVIGGALADSSSV